MLWRETRDRKTWARRLIEEGGWGISMKPDNAMDYIYK